MEGIAIIAAAAAAAAAVLTAAIGTFFVRFAVMRKDRFNPMIMPEAEKESSAQHEKRQRIIKENAEAFRRYAEAFMAERGTEMAEIVSSDGIPLKAEVHPADGHRWAILIHGYMGNRMMMRNPAAVYSSWGYSTLLPDNRAHGESGGKWVGMGWLDKDDIRLWIDWIAERDPDARIVLHGISMGGATVMMASGLELPENVRAAVEDCGYTSVWDIFRDELKAVFHLPAFPVLHMYSVMSSVLAGYSPRKASSLRMLGSSRIPMLFIHGDDDHFVGTYMLDACFSAKESGGKEKLLIRDAGHGEAYLRDPQRYFTVLRDFLSRYV